MKIEKLFERFSTSRDVNLPRFTNFREIDIFNFILLGH